MKDQLMPKDFSSTVKDIKLAILQARAKAARLANAEALKLYFYVGGYISKKTRMAEWGSSAIDALSEQLQVELPGLRGFAPSNIKNMRIFFETWYVIEEIRQLATAELDREAFRQLPIAEICDTEIRYLPSARNCSMPLDELGDEDIAAFFSIGFTHHREIIRYCKDIDERLLLFFHRGLKAMVAIELKMGDFHPGYLGQLNFYLSALDKLMKKPDENPTIGLLLCEKVKKPVVELAVQGYSKPIGIATYQALRNIPEPYKVLAPIIDGVRRVMTEYKREQSADVSAKHEKKRKK